VDDAVAERLVTYGWPGNIRELENVVERAVLFTDGSLVGLGDLPEEIRGGARETGRASAPQVEAPRGEVPASSSDGLKEQVKAAMSRLERDLIERALKQTQGNVTHAARLLKISRKGLQLKMKELGLREKESEA